MPSPFPGMDPYLEDPAFWPGFHTTLLTAVRAALTPQLPPGFYAELEQHIWFREEAADDGPKFRKPDVYVVEGGGRGGKTHPTGSTVVGSPPTLTVTLPKIVREVGPHTIQIRDARNRRVVTAIELLSPSNKEPGADRDRYLLKRSEFVANGTHMVEIDLLRSGHRLPIRPVPDGDYYVYVTDAAYYDEVAVWVFTVRDPIPPFPVPLTTDHTPVVLALRPCLDRAYEEANYGPRIDYTAPAVPRLRKPDAEWAADLLKKHSKKKRK
ncbi:MAG: hypothetical protein JWO38_5675 [Gemmataceae bacterium]|nr:hypothetical protein [Gemmataceae bacterium]